MVIVSTRKIMFHGIWHGTIFYVRLFLCNSVAYCRSCSGFKLAQKFREKWLLPPGKIGRSFIGQERSYNYRPGLILNICVAINIPLYKIFIDSKGIFFFYYYNYLPRVYFLLIQLHVTDANYSWKFKVNFIWLASMVFYKHWYYWKCTQGRVCPHIT